MSYSNGLLSGTTSEQTTIRGEQGLHSVGFKLTSSGDFDLENKRLTNVPEAVDNDDAITKHQMEVGRSTKPNPIDVLLLNGRNHMTGDLDLRKNKIILPGRIEMNRKLIINLDTDENDDLSAVNMATLKKYHSDAPEPTRSCERH